MVQAIAVAELRVLSLLSFVHATARGKIFRESIDPRLYNDTGVLTPLGRRVSEFLDSVGFNKILEGCSLDKSHAYLAYLCWTEVYWNSLRMETPIFLFDFTSGRVFVLSPWVRIMVDVSTGLARDLP